MRDRGHVSGCGAQTLATLKVGSSTSYPDEQLEWFSMEPRSHLCPILKPVVSALSQVTVTPTLSDGTGTVYRTAFLHFQLVNCGANIPVVLGSKVIVQDSFDLKPARPGGSISATVIGNDQILWADEFHDALVRTVKNGKIGLPTARAH